MITLPRSSLMILLVSTWIATTVHGAQKEGEPGMRVQYLEIVTPDVEATCDLLAETHGVSFSEPVPELGNARTAALEGGGRIGPYFMRSNDA